MFLAGVCMDTHTQALTYKVAGSGGRGGGDNGASWNLQLPGGRLSNGLWKWSNHHNMPWKSLPLRLSPAHCWPPPWVGTFSSHLLCTWAKLHFIFLWGNLVLRSCPSRKVIYCQARNTALLTQGEHCSQRWSTLLRTELQLAGTSRNLWSISNQILGEVNIFFSGRIPG